jgi:hypothetical protein
MLDKVLRGWSASSPMGGLRFALNLFIEQMVINMLFCLLYKVLNGQTHIEMHCNKLTGKTMKMNRKS